MSHPRAQIEGAAVSGDVDPSVARSLVEACLNLHGCISPMAFGGHLYDEALRLLGDLVAPEDLAVRVSAGDHVYDHGDPGGHGRWLATAVNGGAPTEVLEDGRAVLARGFAAPGDADTRGGLLAVTAGDSAAPVRTMLDLVAYAAAAALDPGRPTRAPRDVLQTAHEVRRPLAVAIAGIELLQDGIVADPAEVHDLLGRMAESLSEVEALTAAMLRRASHSPQAERTPVDLAEVVGVAAERLRALGLARAHEASGSPRLRMTAARPRPTVWGDALGLQGAVTNLMENALKYSPPGTCVVVHAGTDGATAWVSVDDAGPGIAPAQREEIFRPLVRLPGAQRSGSGLGLSVVAETAAAHGGGVKVEPNTRGGSTFTLWLPTAQARVTPRRGSEVPDQSQSDARYQEAS